MGIVRTYMTSLIIKLGEILNIHKIPGSKKEIPTIMISTDSGELVDYYNNILVENLKNRYTFQKTSGGIIRINGGILDIINGLKPIDGITIKGIPDSDPIVGKSFSINKGMWVTSVVEEIIDNIIITRNSVYVIHDISKVRQKKLDDLGI